MVTLSLVVRNTEETRLKGSVVLQASLVKNPSLSDKTFEGSHYMGKIFVNVSIKTTGMTLPEKLATRGILDPA